MTLYAIPDIHGHSAKLERALALIAADGGAAAPVVFLGDLVDRGPDSRGVIQTLIDGRAAGRDWTVLRGNHDQMFLDALADARAGAGNSRTAQIWRMPNNGGDATLAAYGLSGSATPQALLDAVPAEHQAFVAGLPLTHEAGELLFVHAGIRPGVPLAHQSPDDLIWIREPFLSNRRDHGRLIVHGHTPVDRPTHYGNRIALDGGAGFGGPLHVAVFEGRDCWLLTETGRTPLRP